MTVLNWSIGLWQGLFSQLGRMNLLLFVRHNSQLCWQSKFHLLWFLMSFLQMNRERLEGPGKLAPTPVVETSVRRCTHGSLQRDGFKPTFQELPMQSKRRKPKAKPFSAILSENLQEIYHLQLPSANCNKLAKSWALLRT